MIVVRVATNLDFFLFSLRLLTSFSEISFCSIKTVISIVITVTFEITPRKKIIALINEKNRVCTMRLFPFLSKYIHINVIIAIKIPANAIYIVSNRNIVNNSFLFPVFVSFQLVFILSRIFSSPTAVRGSVKINLRLR